MSSNDEVIYISQRLLKLSWPICVLLSNYGRYRLLIRLLTTENTTKTLTDFFKKTFGKGVQ